MTGSRKATKERTHQRLVNSTLKVLYKHGVESLTTGRVAEAAGVAQPTFYVHFRDMDDAMQQAADALAKRLAVRVDACRTLDEGSSVHEPIRAGLTAIVEGLVSEPRLAELFLRHRRDARSPLGERWGRLHGDLRDQVANDLRTAGYAMDGAAQRGLADMLLGGTLGLAEALIDKRITQTTAGLDSLTGWAHSSLRAAALDADRAAPAA